DAWEYEVFTLSFYQSPTREFEPFIDLTLKKENTFRYLRFHCPRDLEIAKGFPAKSGGFCIFDLSLVPGDGLGVRVDDLRGGDGTVRFWAREVVEIGNFFRGSDSL